MSVTPPSVQRRTLAQGRRHKTRSINRDITSRSCCYKSLVRQKIIGQNCGDDAGAFPGQYAAIGVADIQDGGAAGRIGYWTGRSEGQQLGVYHSGHSMSGGRISVVYGTFARAPCWLCLRCQTWRPFENV
jgi:hypothetical protein